MAEPSKRPVPHFAREDLASVRAANIEILLVEHWREVAHYKDIPLSVNWPLYEAIESAGLLRMYTARIHGELVGYVAYKVGPNPHYDTSPPQAVQDVLYLAVEYRRKGVGGQLIAYGDTMLAAEGVQVTYQHSKIALPLDEVLKPQGYEFIETIWGKRLDRG